jgi:hypothetical protein
MTNLERVTVTLPAELVAGIDQLEKNRSRFIAIAVEHELARRRREGLLLSIRKPHIEAEEVAELGFAEWASSLPHEDEPLVDLKAGKAVRWIEGQGWVEDSE